MPTLSVISLVTGLGVLAFWLAWRFRLPSIVLLLLLGGLLGHTLGEDWSRNYIEAILPALLGSAIALLYCDGGRSLGTKPLGKDGSLVGHLVGWGAKIGWLFMAAAAHFVLGLPTAEALLLGGLLMVSAPYVTEPMVEHLGGSPRIALILEWDSYLLSCIGVAWTALMFGAVQAGEGEPKLIKTILITLESTACGIAVGWLATKVLSRARQHVPDWLYDPLSVAMTFACFAVSQTLFWGSGLVASISLGYFGTNSVERSERSESFWSSLRVLYIGVLGICLGMLIPLKDLAENWPERLAFALLLVVVLRPLLVFIGARHGLSQREKMLMCLTWPRGTMTLATATMIATRLEKLNHPEAARFIPITHWVVMTSILIPWVVGPFLLRRCDQPVETGGE